MLWIAAATAYCIVYLAAVSLVGSEPAARRGIGDVGACFRVTLPAADA